MVKVAGMASLKTTRELVPPRTCGSVVNDDDMFTLRRMFASSELADIKPSSPASEEEVMPDHRHIG